MCFYLTWFHLAGDDEKMVGEVRLSITEEEVRKVFELTPEEYPTDCIEVTEKHGEWIKETTKCVNPRFDLFEYLIEIYSD